jgi:hypothetical protein
LIDWSKMYSEPALGYKAISHTSTKLTGIFQLLPNLNLLFRNRTVVIAAKQHSTVEFGEVKRRLWFGNEIEKNCKLT